MYLGLFIYYMCNLKNEPILNLFLEISYLYNLFGNTVQTEFLKKFKFFSCVLDCFDVLILKIIFEKLKKILF